MIIQMNSDAGQGHTGADLSEADILASLFFRVLRYDPARPDDPDRDRFILSKGHGVGGFYCTLAEAGIIPTSLLSTYLKFDSALPGHPVRQKTPFVEINTGALGHGLSVAVGLALSARMKRTAGFRVYVLLGDGELQEGSNWEAAMSAAHFRLGNLVAIVDRNTLQLADRTESIMALEPLGAEVGSFWIRGRFRCRRERPRQSLRMRPGILRPGRRRPARGGGAHGEGEGRLLHRGPALVAPPDTRGRAVETGDRGAGMSATGRRQDLAGGHGPVPP